MPALPRGIISLWYGSIATIPPGFILCDGNNGTPDLRDRFIIGAGGTHAPAATGGTTQHNHPFTGDGHTHFFGPGAFISGGVAISNTTVPASATGITDNTNHLPPYHALVFIMKV